MDSVYNGAYLPFVYKKGQSIIFCPKLILSNGEIYILQGPNGSGKNTFLKLIFGLLKTGGGNIDSIKVRTVAYVHDHNGMYEHLSVSENIKLRLSLYKYNYSSQKMI